MYEPYSQYDLKALPINGCEPFLQVGYVKDPARILSRQAEWILEKFSKCYNNLLWSGRTNYHLVSYN